MTFDQIERDIVAKQGSQTASNSRKRAAIAVEIELQSEKTFNKVRDVWGRGDEPDEQITFHLEGDLFLELAVNLFAILLLKLRIGGQPWT